MTVETQLISKLFTDSLVASYITHLYTLVSNILDVTFGIKTTCII